MKAFVHKLLLPQHRWFVLAVVALLVARCFHLQEKLDGPHLWRQSDTANYIWDFYENGIDLLEPSVCWRGGHKTTILEFPLHEAIAAVFYKAFGPSHVWARLVTLAFFLLSCVYLFRIVKHLSSLRTAQLATVIYMALPLSIFYSRAVHIDFMAVAFAHGMVWYFLLGIEKGNLKKLLIGSAFAIPAFLVKAPYAFYFALPLLWWVTKQRKWGFVLKSAWVFVVPLGLFAWWIWHTKTVNAQSPDWEFIPGYHKFTDMSGWYFGSWHQRTLGDAWLKLWDRYVWEVAGITALVLSSVGLVLLRKIKNAWFFWLWFAGSLLYVVIFFNLNVIHNYYQIPLVAPVAILAAVSVNWIWEKWEQTSRWAVLLWLIPAGIIAENVHYADGHYYKVNHLQLAIGDALREQTEKEDLVIISFGGLGVNCPNLLYAGRRNGWSISKDFLTPELCYRLYQDGATHLGVVRTIPFEGEMAHFTDAFPALKVTPLHDTKEKLYLWELTREGFTPDSNPK